MANFDKVIIKIIVILICILILASINPTNAIYTVGQQYKFSIVNKYTYIDEHGVSNTVENDMIQNYIINNFNQTYLNYSLLKVQTLISSDYLNRGNWNANFDHGNISMLTHLSINYIDSIDNFNPFYDLFNNPVYPGWNKSEFNIKYPYLKYNSRYQYYDKGKDNVFDQINVNINPPEIIDYQNISGSLNLIKQRLDDKIAGTISSYKDKYFKIGENWNDWESNNLSYGVAYTAKMINSSVGLIDFHPAWLGRYSYFTYDNNPKYTTTTSGLPFGLLPNNSWTITSKPDTYYAISPLNQKVNDTSQYASVNVIQNGLSLDINVPFRVQNFNYFFQPTYSNIGTYSYHIDFQYDSNGFLIHKNSKIDYDANNLGQYILESTQSMDSIKNNQNYLYIAEIIAIPIFFLGGISLAILLKRRKRS